MTLTFVTLFLIIATLFPTIAPFSQYDFVSHNCEFLVIAHNCNFLLIMTLYPQIVTHNYNYFSQL